MPANSAGGSGGGGGLPDRFSQVFAPCGVAGDRTSGKLLDELGLLGWPKTIVLGLAVPFVDQSLVHIVVLELMSQMTTGSLAEPDCRCHIWKGQEAGIGQGQQDGSCLDLVSGREPDFAGDGGESDHQATVLHADRRMGRFWLQSRGRCGSVSPSAIYQRRNPIATSDPGISTDGLLRDPQKNGEFFEWGPEQIEREGQEPEKKGLRKDKQCLLYALLSPHRGERDTLAIYHRGSKAILNR